MDYTLSRIFKTVQSDAKMASESHLSVQLLNETKHHELHDNTLSYTFNDNVTKEPPIEVRGLDNVYTVVEIITAVAAVIGNSFVIVVFIKFPNLRIITNYYVISLSVADLLVGLLGIPCAITVSVGKPENFHACIFMNSLLLLLCTSSIFSLVAVTIDRFWAIIHPLTYPAKATHKNALIIIAFSWILASIIGLLPSMGWNQGRPSEPRCFFMEVVDFRYLVFLYFATMLAPTAFMAVVYALIYRAIHRQLKRLSSLMLGGKSEASATLRTQTSAAKGVAVIVLMFVISWIPLYTLNTVIYFCPHCYVPMIALDMTIVLSHLNSVWNPFLYAWGMSDFRLAMRKLLRLNRGNQRLNGQLNYTDHTMEVVAPLTPRINMNSRLGNGTATSLTTSLS